MSNYAGFNKVKLTRPARSTFDRSHDKKLSLYDGNLVPVLVQECIPSDHWTGSTEALVRLAPLLAPIYDRIEVFVHFFFCANYNLWDEWDNFITGGRVGLGTANTPPAAVPLVPQIDLEELLTLFPSKLGEGTLSDYLGVPILPLAGETAADYENKTIDLMPYMGYWQIWYHYYRDRNFIADRPIADTRNGEIGSGIYSTPFVWGGTDSNYDVMEMKVRNYSHDYFTSALPFTQRGEEVLIPLDGAVTYLAQSRVVRSDTDTLLTNNDLIGTTQDTPDFPPGSLAFQNAPNDDGVAARIENIDSISNISTTINDFRTAYALQVWLERNAIGGSRYGESTEAHFGVYPEDQRLNRPEYIGGGRITVNISEVVAQGYSTNDQDTVIPLGTIAGRGITYGNTNRFKYFCKTHGFIYGIMSIMAPPSYHQGLPRMFVRRSFLSYPWPTFAKLGEQEVYKYELYANSDTIPTTLDEDATSPLFGYQSRYADWKYQCNSNHGDFHSTMMYWTAVRDFTSEPELNAMFNLYDSSNLSRVFVVQPELNTRPFWVLLHNKVIVKRALPYFGTPNTMGFV